MGPIQRWGVTAVLAAMAAAGCRRDMAVQDEQERRDPAIQAAWAAAETGNVAQAELQYDAILKARPELARAHLDMAMILMAAEEKPVKAIYHFMRYLELRPETEKRDLIAQNIRKLTVLLGGKAARSRLHQVEMEAAALRAENDALKKALGIQGLPLVLPPQPGQVEAGAAQGPAAGPRAYTVRPGDSLTRIAQLMYGDGTKANRIYEANRARLKGLNALQAGQVLVIPP